MRSRKPKILTIEEVYKDAQKYRYKEKYKNSINQASGKEDDTTNYDSNGRYSLKRHINNFVKKNSRPASVSLKWLYQEVFKDSKTYMFRNRLLNQGHLYTFHYFNPKYKGTSVLPWFDKYPLVLSLGPVVTKQGVRNIGFNLHLVPPKIRIIIILFIFEVHKKIYRYQIYNKRTDFQPVPVYYKNLVKPLIKYGVTFCIRMYIPQRQNSIVQFPLTDWYRAIFIPSRAYDSIKASQLIKEWQKHVQSLGYSTKTNLSWN